LDHLNPGKPNPRANPVIFVNFNKGELLVIGTRIGGKVERRIPDAKSVDTA